MVNRDCKMIKSVDGLATSCQWIEQCDRGSSTLCFSKRDFAVEDKSLCEGSLDH